MKKALQRHGLAWLDPDLDVSSCAADPANASAVREWISEGLPLVVARQPWQRDANLAHVAVGLTLPPPAIRQRVSLVVSTEAILRQSGPMDLVQALSAVDGPCRELIQRILAICKDTKVTPYVYGSALWQTVSGRTYMTEASDLDVLFVCDESSDMRLLLNSLEACEGSVPRLDGEIVVPSGWAAAWREIAAAGKTAGPETVLVKSTYEVQLLRLSEFFGQEVA